MRAATLFAVAAAAFVYGEPLVPNSFEKLPLGALEPRGWLLEQLLRQANSLAGYMSKSTFPGADVVNKSLWVGGDGSKQGGNSQWLPYWTNGQVPLIALIRAANAVDRLDAELDLANTLDDYMKYVLDHRNTTNGWIGPYMNEPGDSNGHGLWDPLNMVRSLMMWAEDHEDEEARVVQAVVAHLTHESELLKTDPVIKWASTRWPTFVQICHQVEDAYLAKYGADVEIMPLGEDGTREMLRNASVLFRQRGMDWAGYYHQTAGKKFPETDVQGWNTIDHGVNNAEGALNWPAVAYRMSGDPADAQELNTVFDMIDTYQGTINAMLSADEVFAGRAPHRGTETCAIVEAMASLENSFKVLGNATLMDRVERLAFNAMPAALTGDMWANVYVQQANSVFAGRTHPTPWPEEARGSTRCGRDVPEDLLDETEEASCSARLGDTPSGEDKTANFFGVSHFPCCITNFPQGWPKFAMHAIVMEESADPPAAVVASLVPAAANFPETVGGGARVVTDTQYPFTDDVTVTVEAKAPMQLKIRIPGWADKATLNGEPVQNGTFAVVRCSAGKTEVKLELNPEIRLEYGWGQLGDSSGPSVQPPTNGLGVTRGPLVFALHPAESRKIVHTYNDPPIRHQAVDNEIGTNDTWNYGLVPSQGFAFVPKASAGWRPDFAFDDGGDFPFYISATARQVTSWGYWQGSMITEVPPASPVDCASNCGDETELRLVPFGSTNIRISVFPWLEERQRAVYL